MTGPHDTEAAARESRKTGNMAALTGFLDLSNPLSGAGFVAAQNKKEGRKRSWIPERHVTVSAMWTMKVMYAAAAKSLQSCPTLCNPIDGSPPGSPVPGILQARTLEWVTISFSNA